MSSDIPNSMIGIKAFVYDVFGTIVDWKTTLTQELSSFATLTSTRCSSQALLNNDWHLFIKKWRNGYKSYIESANLEKAPYKTVDAINHQLLEKLIAEFDIVNLWSEEELENLVNLWHKLDPYKDTIPGVTRLGKKYTNVLLSNANVRLLIDLKRHSKLTCFDYMFSGEIWKCYIPNAKLYLTCCEIMRLCPEEVAVVSNSRSTLKVVEQLGLKTVFLQREDYDEEDEVEEETTENEEEINGFGGQANHEFDLTVNDLEELAKTMGY